MVIELQNVQLKTHIEFGGLVYLIGHDLQTIHNRTVLLEITLGEPSDTNHIESKNLWDVMNEANKHLIDLS